MPQNVKNKDTFEDRIQQLLHIFTSCRIHNSEVHIACISLPSSENRILSKPIKGHCNILEQHKLPSVTHNNVSANWI